MAPRPSIRPDQVVQVYNDLLNATDQSVSMETLAEEFTRRGNRSSRTGEGFTRQALWLVLRKTPTGRKLLKLNEERTAARYNV